MNHYRDSISVVRSFERNISPFKRRPVEMARESGRAQCMESLNHLLEIRCCGQTMVSDERKV